MGWIQFIHVRRICTREDEMCEDERVDDGWMTGTRGLRGTIARTMELGNWPNGFGMSVWFGMG